MRDALTWRALASPELRGLVEPLQDETRRLVLLAAAAAYLAWHTPHVLLARAEETTAYWLLFVLVAAALGAVVLLHRRRPSIASAALMAVGVAAVPVAALVLQSPGPSLVVPPLTLAAVVLLHPLAGLAAAATAIAALQTTGLVEPTRLVETAVASLLAVAAAWVLGRNMVVVAGWSLASYEQARRNTEAAQAHRGELVQALKQLDDAYWRLEQLNLELERARRAAHEARRLKERFAMAVSHELRTPLNLILGFCEMMVVAPSSAYGHRLPATYRGDLEAMYRNASHLSELVDDILDLSQIDADRMALHREWSAVDAIVDEATSTVETLFLNRDLYLRTAIPPDLPPVSVDRTRVRQILINLLGNAARFVQQGGVSIEARVEPGAVVVAVRDTGPGIAAEDLPFVFEEFRQSANPARRRGGSGLGLAVSRRFAELHGGSLTVESAGGATFSLRLPTTTDASATTPHAVPWEGPLGSRVRGEARRRIAVVDEQGEVHHVLRRYLDEFEVVHVSEVEESVRQRRVEPIQAVVLGTPGGAARWRALTRRAPELADLPVVSCPLRTARATAEELGVDDYLVKPVRRESLRAALRRLARQPQSVLVVDDDPGMTRLLSRMVRSLAHGCDVLVANDGETALRLLAERRPDVLLLDLLMPGTDGYAVAAAVRASADLRRTVVIVVSARGLHDETVVATELAVTRASGLPVGEAVRWLRAGLAALQETGTSGPAMPAAPLP
jgi:signal transduction histidine kinase/DNA-binding response OmpR family regulator